MPLQDRIGPLCDLLMGAAYADAQLADREREQVRGMLQDLGGLDAEIEARIAGFSPKRFDLAASARAFAADPEDDRRRVLFLVAAVNDADDEVDFDEDEYLRQVAAALQLPASALEGMTVDVDDDDTKLGKRKDALAQVRKGPPPPPGSKPGLKIDR